MSGSEHRISHGVRFNSCHRSFYDHHNKLFGDGVGSNGESRKNEMFKNMFLSFLRPKHGSRVGKSVDL